MLQLRAQIEEAAAKIKERWKEKPLAGVILGTGLGPIAEEIDAKASIDYAEIPHFLRSTAIGHKGRLICGFLGGVPIVAMEGRFHAYEGYPLQQITLPVRVMKRLGAELLIVTNACGGLNPRYAAGDVMVIDDQINLMGDNPLIGINDDELGPRFPDMSRPYDPELIDKALEIARRENFVAHRGVFVAVSGPSFETRAECRFLQLIGADVVGMSTVPEALVAIHSSMRVLGLSTITDMCLPDAMNTPVEASEVIAVANRVQPKVRKIIQGILEYEKSRAGRPLAK